MPYFETSAKEGVSVNEAFIDMVRRGIQRENQSAIVMPDTIGGSGGNASIKLSANNKGKAKTNVQGKCC